MTTNPDGSITPTEGLKDVWEAEAEARPKVELTLDHLLTHTDDERIHKVAAQYKKGLLTAAEVEYRIREFLAEGP